jgi:pseudouridine synthase
MDLVKGVPERIYPVGRLDADSAGLLILSNDGEFTERLTHPSHQVQKTYRAVVRGFVSEFAAADLRKGILLDDGMTAPAVVEWVDYDEANNASIIDITIHEGRNRQVRRMFDVVGYPVLALTRIQIGPIKLSGIAPGAWRRLRPAEVTALLSQADTRPAELPQQPTEANVPAPLSEPKRAVPNRLRTHSARQQSVDPSILAAAQSLTQQLKSITTSRDENNSSTNPRNRRKVNPHVTRDKRAK